MTETALEPASAESLRAQVQAAAPGLGGLVIDALTEALQTTKRAWATCPSCGKREEVFVQDAGATVNAAKTLMEQTEGKPGTASEQAHGPEVVIVRAVGGIDVDAAAVAAAALQQPTVPAIEGHANGDAGARAGAAPAPLEA